MKSDEEERDQNQIKSKRIKAVILFATLCITGLLLFALTRYFNSEFIIYGSRVLWFIHAICVSASVFFPKGDKKAMYELHKLEYILLGVKIIMIIAFTLVALYFMLTFPGSMTLELGIYLFTIASWNNIFRCIDRIISNIKLYEE